MGTLEDMFQAALSVFMLVSLIVLAVVINSYVSTSTVKITHLVSANNAFSSVMKGAASAVTFGLVS